MTHAETPALTGAELDRLEQLAMAATPGPWTACREGKCKCGQVWSSHTDAPVLTVERGDWGDTYPSIRPVDGETSLAGKFEPFIEKIVYGTIPEESADANAAYIAACSPDVILRLIASARPAAEVRSHGDGGGQGAWQDPSDEHLDEVADAMWSDWLRSPCCKTEHRDITWAMIKSSDNPRISELRATGLSQAAAAIGRWRIISAHHKPAPPQTNPIAPSDGEE